MADESGCRSTTFPITYLHEASIDIGWHGMAREGRDKNPTAQQAWSIQAAARLADEPDCQSQKSQGATQCRLFSEAGSLG